MFTWRSYIFKQTCSFQVQVCLIYVTFEWTPSVNKLNAFYDIFQARITYLQFKKIGTLEQGATGVVLVFLLLTLNIFRTLFYCFCCQLWVGKYQLRSCKATAAARCNLNRIFLNDYVISWIILSLNPGKMVINAPVIKIIIHPLLLSKRQWQ